MLRQIQSIAQTWSFGRCGVGFGGPVDFANQRVALSTHVGGWRDFPLVERLAAMFNVPVVMDNDANVGALGEARSRRWTLVSADVLHDALHRNRRRHRARRRIHYRGADSWAGEIGHLDHPPRWSRMPLRRARMFRANVLRPVAGARLRKARGAASARPGIRESLRRRSGHGIKGGHHAAKSCRYRDRWRHRRGRAMPLFEPLRAELRRQVTNWSRARLNVVPASLGGDSVLWGRAQSGFLNRLSKIARASFALFGAGTLLAGT